MAVWGEVYAFELPFFLFWKDGFVLGRDFLRRFSTVECRHEAYPNRTQKPFSFEGKRLYLWANYASDRHDLPSQRKIDHD